MAVRHTALIDERDMYKTRLEGHDPADVATLGKKALEVATLKVQLAKVTQERDTYQKDAELLSIEKGHLKESLASAEAERDESDGVIEMLSKRLAEVCYALKGEPPPNVMFSYHDLGEIAAQVKLERDELKAAMEAARKEGK